MNQPSDELLARYDIFRNRHVLAEYILSKDEYISNVDAPSGSKIYNDYKYYLMGMMDLYNEVTGAEASLEDLRRQFAPKDDLDIIRQNNGALKALQEGSPF